MKNKMLPAAVFFCLSASCGHVLPAFAQETDVLAPAPTPIEAPAARNHPPLENLKNMTPEERQAFVAQHRSQLQNMTPEEKEALKAERKAKLQNLSPAQKEQLKAALQERAGGREWKGRRAE